MHVRCRESRSYGDFNACFDPRVKLIMCAANSVLTFHVSSPRPLNKSASSLRLCLFHCLLFSVLPYGFERRRTCSHCYICAPFLSFSSHKFLHLFIFAHPFIFLLPLVPSIFFRCNFPLFPSLRAPLLSPSTLFFCAPHRTRISCLFQFSLVSIFAQRQASYNSYTSLLPHSSCDHAYYVHFGMVSS